MHQQGGRFVRACITPHYSLVKVSSSDNYRGYVIGRMILNQLLSLSAAE